MPVEGPSRFKSRFSSISLRPSRHPPLIVSHPMPPTQPVQWYPSVVSNENDSSFTVRSDHPLLPTPSCSVARKQDHRTPSPHRPPFLNLRRTEAIYPSQAAVNSPDFSLPPVIEKPSKARKVVDDSFDVAEVEPGHRYTPWKSGKVDIRPGELIPHGVLGTSSGKLAAYAGKRNADQSQCESVLHNVLLTPTYLGSSPLPVPSPSPSLDASNTEISHAYRRSPGHREWDLGAMSDQGDPEDGSKRRTEWKGPIEKDSKVKWRHKIWKVSICVRQRMSS